jgi:hypothetical protein
MDCQDVATLPTPCLLIDHAVIGIGVCGDSCYVGLVLISLPVGYVIVDHIVVERWTVVELL